MANEQRRPTPTPEGAQPQPQTVTLTVDQFTSIVDKAVQDAVAKAGTAPAARRRPTNRDFELQNMGTGRQSQEDVVALATAMGPTTHYQGFLPFPPEHVAARDLNEHSALINRIEAHGYVVSLDRVEFRVRYEPTRMEYRGDRQVKVLNTGKDGQLPPEPKEAQPLIRKLLETEPRFSRIWIERWVNRKPITGDRQLDDLAAEDQHRSIIQNQRDLELSRAEAAILPTGEGLGYLQPALDTREAAIG